MKVEERLEQLEQEVRLLLDLYIERNGVSDRRQEIIRMARKAREEWDRKEREEGK